MKAGPSAQPKRDFGTGKTFFLKALAARAHEAGLATAYIRISYPDVALKPLALYATIARTLRTRRQPKGFFRAAIDRWVHRAAERASDPTIGAGVSETSPDFGNAVDAQLRVMLGDLFDRAPSFAQALAGYARALGTQRARLPSRDGRRPRPPNDRCVRRNVARGANPL